MFQNHGVCPVQSHDAHDSPIAKLMIEVSSFTVTKGFQSHRHCPHRRVVTSGRSGVASHCRLRNQREFGFPIRGVVIDALLTTDAAGRPGDRVKTLERDRLVAFFAYPEFTSLVASERVIDEGESFTVGSKVRKHDELFVQYGNSVFYGRVIVSDQHLEIAAALGLHPSAFRQEVGVQCYKLIVSIGRISHDTPLSAIQTPLQVVDLSLVHFVRRASDACIRSLVCIFGQPSPMGLVTRPGPAEPLAADLWR